MKLTIFLVALVIGIRGKKLPAWKWTDNGSYGFQPCNGSKAIIASYTPNNAPEIENQYSLTIILNVTRSSRLEMEFDSAATVTLCHRSGHAARIHTFKDKFYITCFHDTDFICFTVKGPPLGAVPYLTSLKLNNVEYCENPDVGTLDQTIQGYRDVATTQTALGHSDGCGRRKVKYTELIFNGIASKAGDWPWHAAIYEIQKPTSKYICGGTLITKLTVVTAAHCVTINGQPVTPDTLKVVLGKYNLASGDPQSQEILVRFIDVHHNYAPTNYFENDIALMRLSQEATYTDYVQPACIWSTKTSLSVPPGDVFGTVVGWGLDQSEAMSTQLKEMHMPIVLYARCLKKNPLFYASVLSNQKKFCAGWANGTSACNGDSGGGFVVFVPDKANDDSANPEGAWYLRGIVSLSASLRNRAHCDPHQYVVFTDITKYARWIRRYVD